MRDISIQVRMSRAEQERIKRVASLYGVTVSEFVRMVSIYAERVKPELTLHATTGHSQIAWGDRIGANNE